MGAVDVRQVIARDGELVVTGLPYKSGETVRVVVFPQPATPLPHARLTVGHLRRSGLIGIWQDRADIEDSSAYARRLRGHTRRA